MTNMTYDHPRAGVLIAVPAEKYRNASPGHRVPFMADWVVTFDICPRPPAGFITDERAVFGRSTPSETEPENSDLVPFEAYDAKGRFITAAHSIHGALLAVGNRT